MKTYSIIISTFVIPFICAHASFGQIEKGRIGLGGLIGFNYSNSKDISGKNDSIAISFQPSLSFYISDKTALGLNFTCNFGSGFRRTLKINPFLKIAKDLNENLFIVSRIDANGSFGKEEGAGKRTSLSLGWTPGVEYFIGKNWSASASFASVGFSFDKYKPNNNSAPTTNSNFGAALDFSSIFGLSYYFGGNK